MFENRIYHVFPLFQKSLNPSNSKFLNTQLELGTFRELLYVFFHTYLLNILIIFLFGKEKKNTSGKKQSKNYDLRLIWIINLFMYSLNKYWAAAVYLVLCEILGIWWWAKSVSLAEPCLRLNTTHPDRTVYYFCCFLVISHKKKL